MSKRAFIITIITIVLLFSASVAFLLYLDEPRLDYSSMDIETGPKDAAINGYTLLQEVSQGIEFDLSLLDEVRDHGELPNLSPFAAPSEALAAEEMRAIVETNQRQLGAIQKAFEREVFRFDEEPNSENFPYLGPLNSYVRSRCVMAQLMAMEGEPEAALRLLIALDQQIARLGESGGLLTLLSAAAYVGMTNEGLVYLISHDELSDEALRQAMNDYPLRGLLVGNYGEAIRFDFQFALSMLDDAEENPRDLNRAIDLDVDFPMVILRLAYKPNATRNMIYQKYSQIATFGDVPYNERPTVTMPSLSTSKKVLSGNLVGYNLLPLMITAFEKVFERLTLHDFHSECVYLMMALRRYELANGQLPPTLEALVPEYIDAIPADPFDGQPIRYDARRAILYSVGDDGVDNGGSMFLSRFDSADPAYEQANYDDELAHLDIREPTFHLRFDLEPKEAKTNEE